MDTATSELKVILRRLEKLEKKNSRFRQAGFGVLLLVFANFVLGESNRPFRTMEAEKFVLRDANGRSRLALMIKPDGEPSLGLFDKNGDIRLELSTLPGGHPSVSLLDSKKKIRMLFGTPPESGPTIVLSDDKHSPRIELSVADNGSSAGFTLNRPQNKAGLELVVDQRNVPQLRMFDELQASRVVLFAGESGGPRFVLFDEDNQPIFQAPTR